MDPPCGKLRILHKVEAYPWAGTVKRCQMQVIGVKHVLLPQYLIYYSHMNQIACRAAQKCVISLIVNDLRIERLARTFTMFAHANAAQTHRSIAINGIHVVFPSYICTCRSTCPTMICNCTRNGSYIIIIICTWAIFHSYVALPKGS